MDLAWFCSALAGYSCQVQVDSIGLSLVARWSKREVDFLCLLPYFLKTMVTSSLLVRLCSVFSLSRCCSLSSLCPLMCALCMIWWVYLQVADLCPLEYYLDLCPLLYTLMAGVPEGWAVVARWSNW